MWISSKNYDSLLNQSAGFKKEALQLKSLLSAIGNAQDGRFYVGNDVVVLTRTTCDAMTEQLKSDKDQIMKLTAERDWYKREYAELIIQQNMNDYSYEEVHNAISRLADDKCEQVCLNVKGITLKNKEDIMRWAQEKGCQADMESDVIKLTR